ncbi:MAG: Rieske 2Fe-2S domain-containing protein [Anaerolineales bacterium]|jgi:Rieske Fe-S protein
MDNVTRRDFLNLLKGTGVVIGAGAVAAPVIAYFYPPKLEEMPSEPILVCAEDELPVGDSRTVKFGRYPAIVIRLDSGLKAFSAVCSHFACIVKWNPETTRLECPCHDGYFSPEDGAVLDGPPPSPLTMLDTEIVDGQIYVKIGGEA